MQATLHQVAAALNLLHRLESCLRARFLGSSCTSRPPLAVAVWAGRARTLTLDCVPLKWIRVDLGATRGDSRILLRLMGAFLPTEVFCGPRAKQAFKHVIVLKPTEAQSGTTVKNQMFAWKLSSRVQESNLGIRGHMNEHQNMCSSLCLTEDGSESLLKHCLAFPTD